MRIPLPKLRELKEAIKALIVGPYTTKFPKKPSIPFKKFRGKPIFDEKECVGCGACAEVCPADDIDIIDEKDKKIRRIVYHTDSCIFCGQCQAACITEKGVILSNTEYDLAVFDRKDCVSEIQKELLLCHHCGEVIGAKDHLKFLVKKLGPLAYANPLLMLTAQKDLKIVGELPPEETPALRRTEIFRMLCPKCRRQVLLHDTWGAELEKK